MADASLDDFFAKKDKTKKKSKNKLTPIDILAQAGQVDEPKKIKKKKDKKKEKENKETEQKSTKKDDEEWVDFEEKEVDYSGLRIASLQLNKEEEAENKENEEIEEEEEGDDGEVRERKEKGPEGPWNKSSAGETDCAPAPEPERERPVEPKATIGGKYVPPSMRGMELGGSRSGIRKKKTAPNIKSEEDFPTLGMGQPDQSGGVFEEVRGSSRQVEDSSKRTQHLELGNKFGALQDSYH